LDFYQLGTGRFDNGVVPYPDPMTDLDTAPAMQPHAQRRGSGAAPGQQLEKSNAHTGCEILDAFHASPLHELLTIE
jgi:hypothetical protein